jgi:hypothetical protein
VATILASVVLVETSCASCGITFAVPEWWQRKRRDDGQGFYCPNGHSLVYGANTLEKRLKEAERARDAARAYARSVVDQNDAERRSHAATKGQLTKVRKRVAAGVCPCCNRTFQNVSRHMAGQHPDYAKAATDG